jgi:hypothetical protein
MTSAEFNARYQLVKQVTEGAVCTYHAVASTGAVVMVHILDPGALDENRVLVELLGSLDPAERPRILEVDEVDGATIIVTRFILDFPSLRGWLEAHASAEPGGTPPTLPFALEAAPPATPEPRAVPDPQPPAQSEPPAGTKEPGEFTRLFRSPAADSAPAEPAEPAAKEPGEFTRMFRAQAKPEKPVASAPPPAREDPDDRTRLFAAEQPRKDAPLPFPTPPPGSKPAGEFTRIMRAAAAPPDPPSPPPAAVKPPPAAVQPPLAAVPPPPPAPPAQPPASGEFSRMFGAQSGPPPHQENPFGAPHSGLTGRFAAPGQGGKAGAGDDYLSKLDASRPSGPSRDDPLAGWGAAGPAGPPPSAPRPSGAGEYTRIISALPPAPEPPRAPPPPRPPPKPDKARPWLIGGLIAIAVLAAILVLVFALVGGGGDEAPATPPDSSAPAATTR